VKILRTILYTIAIVAGIVLASVNMTLVPFIYLPALRFLPRPEGAQIEAPLALLLLGALVIGTLIAGTGSFVEHVRLRMALRRQNKRNEKLTAEVDKLRAELEAAHTSAESRSAELAAEREKVRHAQEALAQTSAELAHERERSEHAGRSALVAEPPVDAGGAAEIHHKS